MTRKSPKRIVFNISEDDHEMIKKLAASQRVSMRTWIVNAMALAIRTQNPEILQERTHEQIDSM